MGNPKNLFKISLKEYKVYFQQSIEKIEKNESIHAIKVVKIRFFS